MLRLTCIMITAILVTVSLINSNQVSPSLAQWPARKNLQLRNSDIIHTVKTTKKFHYSRLNLLLWTWISEVPKQTYIITDSFDPFLCLWLGCEHQVIAKDCGDAHTAKSLSCKLGFEFDSYIEHATKWWCHWDDDNYVNLNQLRELLELYDHEKPWYVGRKSVDSFNLKYDDTQIRAEFAHGGCGFCISKALAMLLKPLVYKGQIIAEKAQIHNDDVMIGIFINHVLGFNVTTSDLFNSHWHWKSLKALDTTGVVTKQISLSYNSKVHVTFNSDRSFPQEVDETRFLSIHCHLYPTTPYCTQMENSKV